MQSQAHGRDTNGSFGLSGWPKILANLTAVGVVCVLLIRGQDQLVELHQEDRQIAREELKAFRDELRSQREHDGRQRAATNSLIHANRRLLEELLRLATRQNHEKNP